MLFQLVACFALVAFTFAAGGSRDIILGAPVKLDKSEALYVEFARHSLQDSFTKQRSLTLEEEDIELVGSTAQDVAGIRYEYFFLVKTGESQELCETSLWVRSWLTQICVNQLDDPMRCGSLDSVRASLEEMFNKQSNNLFYAKLSGEPIKVTMQGSAIGVKEAHLSKTACTRYEQENGKACKIPNGTKPSFKFSAQLEWKNNGWVVNNTVAGNM